MSGYSLVQCPSWLKMCRVGSVYTTASNKKGAGRLQWLHDGQLGSVYHEMLWHGCLRVALSLEQQAPLALNGFGKCGSLFM